MKIYFAGFNPQGDVNSWQYQLTVGKCDMVKDDVWLPVKKAILGSYDYAGPFTPVESTGRVGLTSKYEEHDLRRAAIRCSDLVFSWMPDHMALWELGLARGAGVKTAVAGPAEHWHRTGMSSIGVDYKLEAAAAPLALIEAVKALNAEGHWANGVWRKMVSKWGSACMICGDSTEVGDDIMWRKKNEEDRGGDVCHIECFALNAPYAKMDQSLQEVGMGLLRKRVKEVEAEKARLIETIQDLVEENSC